MTANSDDSKSAMVEGLGGGAARAHRGGEESGDGCGEDRARASAFIGARGRRRHRGGFNGQP
jgi:hypothetical protein